MVEFHQAMESAGLYEVLYIGGYYTWCNNGKGKERIVLKIDQAFTNFFWDNRYLEWIVKVLSRFGSDHAPLFGH